MSCTTKQSMPRCVFVIVLLSLLLFCTGGCVSEDGITGFSFSHLRQSKDVGDGFVEIRSVRGCERSQPTRGPARETHHCFAEKSELPVKLYIRGRGFPPHDRLGVLLEEHVPLPFRRNNESDKALIVMECVNVQASHFFPKQILSCTLPHPSKSLIQKPEWLKRLTSQTLWMDLKLLRSPKSSKQQPLKDESGSVRQKAVTIGLLPRAVELDLSVGASERGVAGEAGTLGVPDDLLESLYPGSHNAFISGPKWGLYGIGGLKNELRTLFRRVFLTCFSSLRPIVDSIHIPFMRGVLLHGPPGNGKTLIARAIAKMLSGTSRVTIVNGPDIISKYVGESERNLRDLIYDDTEGEKVKEGGDHKGDGGRNGRLNVVIIDEIEALFRRRGDTNDDSSAKAMYDGLTNQLLVIMDGIEDRGNILIIGLTNRLHAIDHALLRPGRFEVVIEIPPPDLEGRAEMLLIHTRELREKGYLAPDIDINLLASRTGGFSGADIAGTVRAAFSHALVRYHDALGETSYSEQGETNFVDPDATPIQFLVTNGDFKLALQDMLESKEQTLPGNYFVDGDAAGRTTPLVDYDGSISQSTDAVNRVLRSIFQSRVIDAAIVVISGPTGTGKTVLAQQLLKTWPFDMRKILTASELHGNPSEERLEQVITTLRSTVGFKGNCSIVIENVEQFFRYSNAAARNILKAAIHDFRMPSHIHSFSRSGPSATLSSGKRVLIITTSDKELMQDLFYSVEYDLLLKTHPIQQRNLLALLQHYGILPPGLETSNQVLRAYPKTMSYLQFLHITDLALWRAHNERVLESNDSKNSNDTIYSRLNALFLQGGPKGGEKGAVPAINTEHHQQEFSAAVRGVVSGMGLSDALDGFLRPDADFIEGEEVFW